jgi:4-alpha-glucanotransferase
VVYSGTHDNDTSVGWHQMASEKERAFLNDYVGGGDPDGVHWDLIRLAFGSIADIAVVPLQDVLGLGSEARMNTPGVAGGNWSWRYTAHALTPEVTKKLKTITYTYSRGLPPKPVVPPVKQKRPHPAHLSG